MRPQTENREELPGDNGLCPIQSFVKPDFGREYTERSRLNQRAHEMLVSAPQIKDSQQDHRRGLGRSLQLDATKFAINR